MNTYNLHNARNKTCCLGRLLCWLFRPGLKFKHTLLIPIYWSFNWTYASLKCLSCVLEADIPLLKKPKQKIYLELEFLPARKYLQLNHILCSHPYPPLFRLSFGMLNCFTITTAFYTTNCILSLKWTLIINNKQIRQFINLISCFYCQFWAVGRQMSTSKNWTYTVGIFLFFPTRLCYGCDRDKDVIS